MDNMCKSVCVLKYLHANMCFRGNLLRDKGNAEAAVSSYKNAIKYRSSLAGNAFFVYTSFSMCNVHKAKRHHIHVR